MNFFLCWGMRESERECVDLNAGRREMEQYIINITKERYNKSQEGDKFESRFERRTNVLFFKKLPGKSIQMMNNH